MDSSPTFTFLPPPPPPPPPANPNPNHHHTSTAATQPPDITTTLSALKHLIHLSKSTLTSLSTILPTPTATATTTTTTTTATTTATTATCPYNSNHCLPPSSLFRHHLLCPSSPSPIPLSLLQSLHYPNSLQSPITTHKINHLNSSTDLSISLTDYHTSLDSNFFYTDCPAVVTFPQHNNNADLTLTLPAVLSAECAGSSGDGEDDVTGAIDGLFSSGYFVKLLPSEYYNVRIEISQWNDYPLVYSRGVVCLIVCCCYLCGEDGLMEWMLVNSPFYGVVIDVFMRDHMLLLFRVCLRAIAREAVGYMVSFSKGERTGGGDCPVLYRVLMWLGLQFGILYGEMNGKLFAINMLKQALLNVSSKSLISFVESSGLSDKDGDNGSKENDGRSRQGKILVSQIAAAVAALHERSAFETRIKAIRALRFVPVYQRVQEHEYISKAADEERKKRPNYRPIIEHDGVLWHRGGNQDSNKNKSQEELIAEERDYKRRRMSYRGKKMKRSTTQVMRDIIEEIKHANMASADAINLESGSSSISNIHVDKHRHDEIKQKTLLKESVSARCEDKVREKSNKHGHKDNRSSIRKRKDRSSSPNNHHKSKHKDRRSSSNLPNEFEDRYDPSKSHDSDVYGL
ncbi:putative U11/U12 small nuclear ribonucleoprotein 48kDa protein [Helianthus debilis subsp. tardiflorus]